MRVGDVLAQLGELGLGLSLDDFGTGFSSLTHLKSLPVGEVKIDRSFVGRMTTDPVDAAIVQATIQLAHSIGIRVVAEGIEDQVTWSSLVANHCELVQGYALSRPLPATTSTRCCAPSRCPRIGDQLNRVEHRARRTSAATAPTVQRQRPAATSHGNGHSSTVTMATVKDGQRTAATAAAASVTQATGTAVGRRADDPPRRCATSLH